MMDFDSFTEIKTYVLLFLAALLTPLAIYKRWRKTREARLQLEKQDAQEILVGTDADREAAEEYLRFSPLETRQRMLRTHELVARLFSTHGYTRDAVWKIIEELFAQDIRAEVLEQPTVPAGEGTHFLELQGVWELYVPREQADEAVEILKKLGHVAT